MSDWIREQNLTATNYQVVKSPSSNLHFYVVGNGDRLVEIDATANALENFLNFDKKSPLLTKDILIDEIVMLKGGVTIGVAGAVTNIKGERSSEKWLPNPDRVEFLKNLVSKF